MKGFVPVIFFLLSLNLQAQLTDPLLQDAAESNASISEETVEDVNPVEIEELQRHKINLNTGPFDALLRLQLLNMIQVNALENHRKRFGNIIALQELQVIPEFNKETIQRIFPYVKIDQSVSPGEMRRELIVRYKRIFSGYSKGIIQPAGLLIKYRYDISKNISVGFLAEKDADENIQFNKNQYGFDFNSFFFYYKETKWIRKWILGDFRIQYGQGLTAWTGGSFSGNTVIGIFKAGAGISPSISTDENNYLRGSAISIGIKKWTIDCWLSAHKRDAKLYIDPTSESSYFTSFQTTGLHRYEDEFKNKKTVWDQYAGCNVNYQHGNLSIGSTGTIRNFNSEIRTTGRLYDQFDFQGKTLLNLGINYRYVYHNTLLFGEISSSQNGAISYIHGMIISIGKNLTVAFHYRNYSPHFQPGNANAIGAGSSPKNEEGIYTGFQYQLTQTISGQTLLDNYNYPFIKYRVDKPSMGNEFIQQVDYTPGKKLNIQFRYKRKMKELNFTTGENKIMLEDQYAHAFRMYSRFAIDDNWDYATRIEYLTIEKNNRQITGMSVSTDLFYHPKLSHYSWNARYAVFNCKDFDARIYQYENDIPGSFSIPFYYGKGNRFYFNLNYQWNRSTTLSIRYAVTDYTSGGRSAELRAQLRIRLS